MRKETCVMRTADGSVFVPDTSESSLEAIVPVTPGTYLVTAELVSDNKPSITVTARDAESAAALIKALQSSGFNVC